MAAETDDDACALCGGAVEDHELSEEREEQLRENIPDLDGKHVHALVCTECGHVSYHQQDE